MMSNMGTTDRIIRAVIGIALALLPLFDVVSGALAVVLYIGAAIMLATAAVSFCPLYRLFGWSTSRVRTGG